MPIAGPAPGATHPILANDYASQWLGITVLEVSEGHAVITMTVRREMLNGFGIAHGGMIFALADTAFALACNPAVPDPGGTITVAAGADIHFLKSALPGQLLTAIAERRHQSGRSGIYDIQVLAEEQLIAEFRGRSRTIPKK